MREMENFKNKNFKFLIEWLRNGLKSYCQDREALLLTLLQIIRKDAAVQSWIQFRTLCRTSLFMYRQV
jgi:hypothetical protein